MAPSVQVKSLGVSLDITLSFEAHIIKVTQTAYYHICNINCKRGALTLCFILLSLHIFTTAMLFLWSSSSTFIQITVSSGPHICTGFLLNSVLNVKCSFLFIRNYINFLIIWPTFNIYSLSNSDVFTENTVFILFSSSSYAFGCSSFVEFILSAPVAQW